ncbi:putative transposase, partial [Phenoliferia sp. Uapishka_3]
MERLSEIWFETLPPSTPLGRSTPPTDLTPSPRLDSTTPQTPLSPSAPLAPRASTSNLLPTVSEHSEDANSDPLDPPSPTNASFPTESTFHELAQFSESDEESMPTGHEEDRLAAIGPVNAGNWKEWREALTGCLEMLGFDKAMDEAKPAAPDAAVGPYTTENINYRRALKEWTKDTASTIDIIRRHSGTVNTVYLTKGDTPKTWLTNLQTVYNVENVMDGAFLVEAFFAAKYTGGSLTEWLSRFAELAEKVNIRYESSIPKDNKRTIFDRLLQDSIIIRIGDEWRKELGDVKPSDTTADVVGVLTRKYDFHLGSSKRDEDQALLVSSAIEAASALVVAPVSTKKPDVGRGKSKLERALNGVGGAICKLFAGWIVWPGGISASGRFLVVSGMCYRCLDFGHLAGDCPFTNDHDAQVKNQTSVLLHYKIKLPLDSLRVRLKDAFCGDGWLGGKKGSHAVGGSGKWTRKAVAGKDGKVIGAGGNHGYVAVGTDEEVYAAGDSEDNESLFAATLTYSETQIEAFDRAATVYHTTAAAMPGSFDADDIWLVFGSNCYVGGPDFRDEEEEGLDEMPGLSGDSSEDESDALPGLSGDSEDESDALPVLSGASSEEGPDAIPGPSGVSNTVEVIREVASSVYPPFDVTNAYLHARLDHSAYRPPHAPFNNSTTLMPDEWAAAVAEELERLGARTGKDFAWPVGTNVGDLVRAIWDSEANHHYWSLLQYLHDFIKFDSPRQIGGAFGSVGVATGSGTLKAVFRLDDGTHQCVATKDVYYTPGLGANLISAGQLFKQGVLCSATRTRVTLMHANSSPFGYVNINDNGTMFLQASFVRSTPLSLAPLPSRNHALITAPADRDLWHRRLGHCGGGRLEQARGMVDGVSFCNSTPLSPCIKCSQGKITRKPVRKVAIRKATFNLERIAVDIWGPSRVVGLGGVRYVFAIIDQHSCYIFGFAQQLKNQALPNLQRWTRRAERLQGRKLVGIRSDHGGETKSNAMTSWCDLNGYLHEFANPHSHDENGIIERQFRTILNMVRTSLLESGLPLFLWFECFLASIYVKNHLPTRGLVGKNSAKTPYEVWFNEKPDLSNLRVWGCEVVVHYSLELRRDKATDRGWRGFMVGYSETSKAWRIYDPAKRMVRESPDVDFFEDVFRKTPPSDERLSQIRLFDHDLPFSDGPLLEIPVPRPFQMSWEAVIPPSASTPLPAPTPLIPPPASRIPRPSPSTPATTRTPALFDTPLPGAAAPPTLGPRTRLPPVRWQPSGRKLTLQARLTIASDNPFDALEHEDFDSIGHLGGDSEQVPSPPTVSPYVQPSTPLSVNSPCPSSSHNRAHLSEFDASLPPTPDSAFAK